MSNEIDREARALRAVYALMMDRAPSPPTFEELRASETMRSRPTFRPPRRGLALAGTGVVLVVAVLTLLLFDFTSTPSALATVEDARMAVVDLPPFRATLVGHVDGEVLASELAPGTTMEDRLYVNELWYEGPMGWRVDVVEDSVPVLSGGPGSVSTWDGNQLTIYSADENVFSVEPEARSDFGPLRLLDPELAWWPLMSGDAAPSDLYFAEHCEVVSESRLVDRATRRLSCEAGHIEIWLDIETGLVLKAVGPEAGHEVTSFEIDAVFPPGTFEFDPPPGARSADEAAQDPYSQVSLIQGEPAPSWTVPLMDSQSLRLEEMQGMPALILVWADWCPPCIESLPLLQEVHELALGRANVLAVDIQGTRELAESIIADGGYSFPVAIDEEFTVSSAWGVESVPVWVVLDGKGRVVEVLLGQDAQLEPLMGLLNGD